MDKIVFMKELVIYTILSAITLVSIFRRRFGFYFLFAILPFYAFLITYLNYLFQLSSMLPYIRLIKEFLLIGILLSLLLEWIRSKNKPITFYFSDFLILFYLFILVISGLIHHSGLKEFAFGLRYDFFFFFVYFVFRLFFIFSKEEKNNIINLILITAIIVFIFAILQFFVLPKDFLTRFGYSNFASSQFDPLSPLSAFQLVGNSNILRVQSFFAGPNQLASFCLVVIFLSLALFFSGRKTLFVFLSILLGISVLVLTFCRSAWIGFVMGLLFFVFSLPKKEKRFFISIFFLFVALLVILIFLFLRGELYDILFRPSSSPWHLVALKESFDIFKQNLWGMGLGKVGPASQWLNKPFISENYYLQLGLEGGVLSILSFLGAFIFLIAELLKNNHIFSRGVIALIISLLCASFFLHTLGDGILSFYLGVLLALAKVNKEYEKNF